MIPGFANLIIIIIIIMSSSEPLEGTSATGGGSGNSLNGEQTSKAQGPNQAEEARSTPEEAREGRMLRKTLKQQPTKAAPREERQPER